MTPGSLTLACLMLAVHAEPPDTVYMNSGKFAIPITIMPARRAEISALELHMSPDRGQSWLLSQRATPEKDKFEVDTRGDGTFWFSVVVVDTQGRKDPLDLRTAPVGQRVVVDSIRPEITLTAERQGEEIRVSWDIREDNLDPRTLRMEWMQNGALPVVAPILNEPRGRTSFKPLDPQAPVSIRMTAVDLAGNQGMGSAEVPVAVTAPPGHTASRYVPVQPSDQVRQPDVALHPGDSPESRSLPPFGGMPPPPPPPGTLATTPSGPTRTVAYGSTTPLAGDPPRQPDYPVTTAVNPQLPQVQIVNKRQVKLEFEVAKYGPTGLGGVDVWVTMDDGRTWEQSKIDPSSWSLPGNVNGIGPLHGSVTVQLNQEATVYGFYLIVKSRALLGKPPPRPGDAPQIRIELDTTAPFAQLFEPQADPSQPNTLNVIWKANDAHLASNPITLEWAAKREGPWQFIGEAALPNTGRFNWRITNDMPSSVFLRLTVRDTAGNTAIAETDKPVLVDLTIPELTVIGVQTGPR